MTLEPMPLPDQGPRLSPDPAELQAVFPAVRREWQAHLLATGPADRDQAVAAVHQVYNDAGLAAPQLVVWVESPPAGIVAAATISTAAPTELRRIVGYPALDRVWAQPRAQIQTFMDQHVPWETRTLITRNVTGPLEQRNFRELVEREAMGTLGSGISVPTQVAQQVREQLGEELGDLVPDQPVGALSGHDFGPFLGPHGRFDAWWQADPVWFIIRTDDGEVLHRASLYHPYAGGQLDAPWLAYMDALHRLGVPGFRRLRGIADLARQVGQWWAFGGAAILCERPVVNARDERGRLHAEDGPAIAYTDGWAGHAWHGTMVPPGLITGPLDLQDWLREPNVELRRIMAERIGYDKLLTNHRAHKIATDDYGTLWLIPHPFGDDEDIVVVEVLNSTPEPDGSIRRYVLRVPPRFGSQFAHPRDAIGWTFGMDPGDYSPAVMT